MNHQPVLLTEALDGLAIQPGGVYIDATFGRGGHSRAILQRLGERGKLLVIDKDQQAIDAALLLQQQFPQVSVAHDSFARIAAIAQQHGLLGQVNGILLDLGVSSPQLDEQQRGFSFMRDGPLDMRMDQRQSLDAAGWLNLANEQDIANVLWQFGDERFSRRIARAIVAARASEPLSRTLQLAEIIASAVPRRDKHKHPATRSFQAIRIYINRELEDLQQMLQDCLQVLAIQGRLAVITFHSLEDRLVKQFLQKQVSGDDFPPHLPIPDKALNKTMKIVARKIKPSADEIEHNTRARSATLRIAEKIA